MATTSWFLWMSNRGTGFSRAPGRGARVLWPRTGGRSSAAKRRWRGRAGGVQGRRAVVVPEEDRPAAAPRPPGLGELVKRLPVRAHLETFQALHPDLQPQVIGREHVGAPEREQ